MTTLRESIRRLFAPPQPIPAGTYHFQAPPDADHPYRLHLRIEPDGKGVLIVNASTIIHLNNTAAEFAYHLIQGTPEDEAARLISNRYHVNFTAAKQDFRDLTLRIQALITSPDLDPVVYLDFDRHTPYTQSISAPYRLDCALTYRLPEGADPSAAPTKRVDRELTTAEWQQILDTAWKVGIPHIIFTGGEPTLREDLPTLISYAEAKGQVSGLLTDGLLFANAAYLDTLLQTGLDHVMMILQPDNEQSWTALKNLIAADIFVVVHLTLSPANATQMTTLLQRLAAEKVEAISLSTISSDLRNSLITLRDNAASLGLSLVWDLPVPYSAMHPVAIETEEDAPSQGAGRAWLYVEPDGDVLVTQGVPEVIGNLLRDPWEKIWKVER